MLKFFEKGGSRVRHLLLNVTLFFTGALGYSLLEVLWRGFTHWTMALTGGTCLVVLYNLFVLMGDTSIWIKCLAGSLAITTIEFAVGCLVNIVLKWNVWSYDSMPFNLLGQVCLLYSVLWYFLSIPLVFLTAFIQKRFA